MKLNILTLFIFLFSCSTPEEEIVRKKWLGKPVDFSRIIQSVNRYDILDSTAQRVGSMSFGWAFENGMLVSRDTSQFDNGSVYETAVFKFDTSRFQMGSVAIDMQMGAVELSVAMSNENGRVIGATKMARDTLLQQSLIDSLYGQDVFREELYMLLHTLDYQENDSLSLDVFVPLGLGISKAAITYVGQEDVEVPMGAYNCTVIRLQSDGRMPTNKIWISNEEPKKMVKFYVPGPELTIELREVIN